MPKPELLFVVGCNAAGKPSFIRTRINNLDGFEIIMTDVYKGRSKEVFLQAVTFVLLFFISLLLQKTICKDVCCMSKIVS